MTGMARYLRIERALRGVAAVARSRRVVKIRVDRQIIRRPAASDESMR